MDVKVRHSKRKRKKNNKKQLVLTGPEIPVFMSAHKKFPQPMFY